MIYKYETNYILPKAFIVFDNLGLIREYPVNNLSNEYEIINNLSYESLNLLKIFENRNTYVYHFKDGKPFLVYEVYL